MPALRKPNLTFCWRSEGPQSALTAKMCMRQHRSQRALCGHSLRLASMSAITTFGSFIGPGPRCSDQRKLSAEAPHRRVKRGVVEARPICAVFLPSIFSDFKHEYSQPFQPGAPPLQQGQFQVQPCRRSRRVAPTLFSISSGIQDHTETGSHWSDTTASSLRMRVPSLLI